MPFSLFFDTFDNIDDQNRSFSLGRPSTHTDVERAGDVLEDTLKILRRP